MFKKILTYSLLTLAVLLLCGYFAVASRMESKGSQENLCRDISVRILDSMENRFVSVQDIREIVTSSKLNPIGEVCSQVSLADIESLLENRSAIRRCEAYITVSGVMRIDIVQRRPILRLQTADGSFYLDETGYIFPWVNTFTSYVPVVSGDLPLKLEKNFRGHAEGASGAWVETLTEFALYLEKHSFWKDRIQQIEIEKNGDLALYMATGDQKIIFGPIDRIDYKFAKLHTYYTQIVPVYGWEKYSTVNLKFSDQIICTKRDKRDIRKT